MTENTEPVTANLDVTLQIPMDALLGAYTERVAGYYGSSDPDEWQEPPAIVLDAIGERVAQLLLSRFESEALKAAQAKVERAVEARIDAIVTEALDGEFQPLNPYGEKTGQPTTVRGMAVKLAQEWFTKEVGNFNRSQKQGPKYIAEIVDKAMREDLQQALTQARAEVTKALKDKAAEAMADTLARMGGVR